jgi:hypothetical protein
VVNVRVNGKVSAVCETHRIAIVKRIEQVVARLGRSGQNVQHILMIAVGEVSFEDLP